MISAVKKLLSKLNRARKGRFKSGFVSVKKFNETAWKYQTLIDGIVSVENSFTQEPNIRCLQSVKIEEGAQDVCIFVSYAAELVIKDHVARHIRALIAQRIAVVLVINTDADLNGYCDLSMPELSGFYVRENKGFDFGAWSHIFKLIDFGSSVDRLYLINDSLIGPLTDEMLEGVIRKVRASGASFIGLTANAEPFSHVQSFFLVLGKKLLNDQRFGQFFKNLWNLPTKGMVIDFYEKGFTRFIHSLGFEPEVLFDTQHLHNNKSDPVIHSIDELLEMDFPYVKTSMALKPEGASVLQRFSYYVNNSKA